MNEDRIKKLTAQGKECISEYSQKAMKAALLPFVSIPLVHGLCVAMQSELDKIFDIGAAKGEKYSNIALGVLATPFILVPLWGAIPAMAYVQIVGESYLKALIKILESVNPAPATEA